MAIWFPLKVGAFCTRRRTAVAMGFLLLLASGLCSTLFEITHDLLVGTDFKCVFKEGKLPLSPLNPTSQSAVGYCGRRN